MTAAIRDRAEDVALVTFSMIEALDSYPEAPLPGGYRYHLFHGFPGLCDHAAATGIAISMAFDAFDRDCWIDIVDDYARTVIFHAVERGFPADDRTLADMAEESRRRAVRDGIAHATSQLIGSG